MVVFNHSVGKVLKDDQGHVTRGIETHSNKKGDNAMKTKNLIQWMMSVVIASILMTGTLFSQTTKPKTDPMKQLQMNVEEAYYRYYSDPISITVSAGGIVELKGSLKTYWDKLNVYANIANVKGVTEILDHLTVDTAMVPDDVIKDEIRNQLKITHVITEPEKINVAVTKGLVILTGTVNFFKEATAAEDVAGSFTGVKSVADELEVMPLAKAETDDNLTAIVQDVLKDQFSMSAKNIQVKVAQGVVTLTGTTNSLWSKGAIEKQIHGILGIKDVTNSLTVKPEFM
jgi:osmotically-inducible protein OsmY